MTRRFPGIQGLCVLCLSPLAWLAAQTSGPPVPSPASGPVSFLADPGAGRHADTLVLTLADARQRAVRDNPSYLASRETVAMASGARRQAGLPSFNPDLSLEWPGLLRGGAGEFELALTQEWEVAGQGRLRRRAADIGVDRARSEVTDAARLVVADASMAWYRAFAAQRRRELAERQREYHEQLLEATRAQLREGEISAMDANLVELEAGRARTRLLAAQREAGAADLALKRVTGLSIEQDLRLADAGTLPPLPDPALLSEDSLIRLALSVRADLAATTATVRESDARTTLARREALPNLRTSLLTRRESEQGAAHFGLGVGITLPFLNRNQGETAQFEAAARQARYLADAVTAQVQVEVVTALRAYRLASEEVAVFTADVLGPAQRNEALLTEAFRAGRMSLPTLLLLRNELLDAQQDYWLAWLAQREALVDLETAIQATVQPDPESGMPATADRTDLAQEDAP